MARAQEAIEQIGGRQAFHEFVLSGNEDRSGSTITPSSYAVRYSAVTRSSSGSESRARQFHGSIRAMSAGLSKWDRSVRNPRSYASI